MKVELNRVAVKYAKNLASRGKVERSVTPIFDAADADRLLGPGGADFEHYSKHHFGVRTDVTEDSREKWVLPFGKAGRIHRSDLVAARDEAAKQGLYEVENAIVEILDMVDAQKGDALLGASRTVQSSPFDWREWMTSKMERTDEGFLKGRAVLTNIGVFGYRNDDGSMRYELRHPSDVFDRESLASLDGKPLTNDHPTEGVDPQNVKDLAVGTVYRPDYDAYHVAGSIVIHREDALADVGRGKVALSCGYRADVIPEEGVFQGVRYTHRQTNIRYNHVAIVDEGRAGDAARLRMDGVHITITDSKNPKKGENMAKLKLDSGAEFDVPEAVASHVDALVRTSTEVKGKLDESERTVADTKKALDAATAEADSLKSSVAKLEAEVAKYSDGVLLQKAVEDKLDLLTAATTLGAKVTAKDSLRDIRCAVIALDTEDSMEGKTDDYVAARYDGAVTNLKKLKPASEPGGHSHSDGTMSTDTNGLVQAFQVRQTTLQNAWKGDKE